MNENVYNNPATGGVAGSSSPDGENCKAADKEAGEVTTAEN